MSLTDYFQNNEEAFYNENEALFVEEKRRCKRCDNIKYIDEYHRNCGKGDGYAFTCYECYTNYNSSDNTNKRSREYYVRNRDDILQRTRERRAAGKPLTIKTKCINNITVF